MGTRPWNGCPGPPTQPVQALANFVYFIILIITIITNVTTLLNTSAQPPEAAPVLGARPAFWPGQDPRSSQDQPGPPRPTAIKIIIGTGEATLTAIGAPPRARWLPLGSMQRTIPGLLISSRCLAPTRPPGPCTAV